MRLLPIRALFQMLWFPLLIGIQRKNYSIDLKTREESILIACGTTVYIWDYMVMMSILIKSRKMYYTIYFPRVLVNINMLSFMEMEEISLHVRIFVIFHIIAHENTVTRGSIRTYTVSRYHLVKDVFIFHYSLMNRNIHRLLLYMVVII